MTKLILTDVDDTLVRFSDHFQMWLNNEHGIVSSERLRHHNDIAQIFNIEQKHTDELIGKFFTSNILREIRRKHVRRK
jgi:FMN phosphatase YigB (HAD superfamily)